MSRRLCLVMATCVFPIVGLASSVIWGGGEIIDQSSNPIFSGMGYKNLCQWLWTIDAVYTMPNVFFEQISSGKGITISGVEMGLSAYGTLLKKMETGDVVDATSMSSVSDPFPSTLIEYGRSIMLGFKTETWDSSLMEPAYGYGWIELGIESSGLVLQNGAYGLDGQSMIAGGGAIPEPSSAILMMIGCCILMVKRSCRACKF